MLQQHCLIVGASGAGKSKMIEIIFYNMITKTNKRKNASLIYIDPHGDSARRIKDFHNIDNDRLVYISSSMATEYPTNDKHTFVINPFENDGSDHMRNILGAELTDAIGELLNDGTGNNQLTINMIAHLRNAIGVLLTLPAEQATLQTLRRFFSTDNEDLVRIGQQSKNPEHRNWFTQEFHLTDHALTKKAIRTKLSMFLADEQFYRMVNGKSSIDIEHCINEGKILVISLPRGANKFVSSLMGRLLIAKIHSIIMRREQVAEKNRRDCYLFIDECQTLLTQSMSTGLQELRKYKTFIIPATQSIKQISNIELRKSLTINTGLKLCGQTDVEDATLMSKELLCPVQDIQKLMPLEFICKKKGGQYLPFKVTIPILSTAYFLSKEDKQKRLAYMVSRYYKPLSETPPPPPIVNREMNSNTTASNNNNAHNNTSAKNNDTDLPPFFTS